MADEFKAITTQDELNKVIGERLERERTKVTDEITAKFPDYDVFKEKSGKFDQQESANKSEIQKLTDRIAGLEDLATKATERANTADAAALRSRIQAKHQISDADAALFLTAADEAGLTAQAAGLAARETERKKKAPHVPREGAITEPEDDEMAAFARDLFKSGD